MRIEYDRNAARPTSYTLWLSARETEDWATKPGAVWPCSTLRWRSLCVEVDSNGLCGLRVSGPEPENPDLGAGGELEALVADHLPAALRHLWPCWESPVSAGPCCSRGR